MNKEKLLKHLKEYVKETNTGALDHELQERIALQSKYAKLTKEFCLSITEEDIYEYFSPLWAMQIWGNKDYYITKIIQDNGLAALRKSLSDILWGEEDIAKRWDSFRTSIKGIGPAMMSELLIRVHPYKYMLWNKKALIALTYLDVSDLPVYNYQVTGNKYKQICELGLEIANEMKKIGLKDTSLVAVDYFFWNSLQITSDIEIKLEKEESKILDKDLSKQKESEFIHNEIRDKIAHIGTLLGFESNIEKKIDTGAKVDVIWQASIGNMGKVIYVFEVQAKGNIKSLCINLLKAKSDPAVQGIFAVSNKKQIQKIKKEIALLKDLSGIKFWDYEDVLKVHGNLEQVYDSIKTLGFVPK